MHLRTSFPASDVAPSRGTNISNCFSTVPNPCMPAISNPRFGVDWVTGDTPTGPPGDAGEPGAETGDAGAGIGPGIGLYRRPLRLCLRLRVKVITTSMFE